ncbi:hypothetical protein ACTMU2_32380 [Cupriavidus basilensis]
MDWQPGALRSRSAAAPRRRYVLTDESTIRGLLTHWNQDTAAHQRALGRIAGFEPAFRDVYASALSDVRKLQTDESVYLAAIDRLNATIATELARDQPEALQPVLADYKEKYPRLAGLDRLQDDLRRYTALMLPLRARSPGPLVARMADAKFATPPFQAQYARLAPRLPGADVVRQYAAAAQAWQRGDSATAIAGLRRISAGPWSDDVAKDAAHKQQDRRAVRGAAGAHAAPGATKTSSWASTPCSTPMRTGTTPRPWMRTSPRSATARCGAHAS